MTSLEVENQSLLKDKGDLIQENENYRQKLHEQRMKLQNLESIMGTFSEEIAQLQSWKKEHINSNVQYEQTITELKKKLNDFVEEDVQHVDLNRAAEIDDYQKQIFSLKNELEMMKKDKSSLTMEFCLQTKTNSDVEIRLDYLEQRCKLLQEKNLIQEKEHMGLQESYNYVVAERNSLEKRISSLRSDLHHVKDMLADVKNDHAAALSKLHAAHAPQMQAKGNSIYSELEDECQKLSSINHHLKCKYEELLRKSKRQFHDISKQMSEKASAARITYTSLTEADEATTEMIEALETQMKRLTTEKQFWEEEAKIPVKVISSVDSSVLAYVEDVITSTKESVYKKQQELQELSLVLYMSQRQEASYKQQIVCANMEIASLKRELTDNMIKLLSKQESDLPKLQLQELDGTHPSERSSQATCSSKKNTESSQQGLQNDDSEECKVESGKLPLSELTQHNMDIQDSKEVNILKLQLPEQEETQPISSSFGKENVRSSLLNKQNDDIEEPMLGSGKLQLSKEAKLNIQVQEKRFETKKTARKDLASSVLAKSNDQLLVTCQPCTAEEAVYKSDSGNKAQVSQAVDESKVNSQDSSDSTKSKKKSYRKLKFNSK